MTLEAKKGVTKTEAVANFLRLKTYADLAALYNPSMECQISVAQDGGEEAEGEYEGRPWRGWTDGLQLWRPFHIPWRANSVPEFTDSPMTWDLAAHAEAIGMTGWNWEHRLSCWLAFDYDAIVGHSIQHKSKLTDAQLHEVQQAACAVDWVTVRRSSSGRGRHLYVHLDPPVPSANSREHAALARAVLEKLSTDTGFDFQAGVDVCGGNMWVWHRKMVGTGGLMLIKRGVPLGNVPRDWRNHVPANTGRLRRTRPQTLAVPGDRSDNERLFDELTGLKVPLDADHNRLIDWLRERQAPWSWNQDQQMLVTHTYWLKEAHKALGLKGPFETVAAGRNKTIDINCFAYALPNGAWVVRRYGNGTAEAGTWCKDRNGYTRCYLNREPGLRSDGRPGFSFTIPIRTTTTPTGER